MTSPGEMHAEMEADRRLAKRQALVAKQMDHLHAMITDCGFGYENSDRWGERKIFEHLNAAYQLLQMERR